MSSNQPALPDGAHVVVAGGGVAALEALLALTALAGDRISVSMLAPTTTFTYRPLAVAAPFGLAEVRRLDLRHAARAHGASFECARVRSVNLDARTLTTSTGSMRRYDALILAVGARAVEAVPGALTYRGAPDEAAFVDLLTAIRQGSAQRVAFVVPAGCSWPLPLYELALMTSRWIRRDAPDAELALITPEATPLEVFGADAAAPLRERLAAQHVALRTGSIATAVRDGRLWMPLECSVAVDRVVALPRLVGRPPAGLPIDGAGFVPVDEFCRVGSPEDQVFAAGDMTDGNVKQGGLAAQQADVCAGVIAAAAGAPVEPEPFDPVLRGLLLTGGRALYLRRGLDSDDAALTLDDDPLWWPAHKIAGRHFAAFLATGAAAPHAAR